MDSKDLEALHGIAFEILLEIDRVCRKNTIDYFLDGGTLLGAARHHDFIPWDDDLDISMMREDYEKFLSVAPLEMDPKYFVQTRFTDPGYPFGYTKVRKNGTLCVEACFGERLTHNGVWVDVFPYDLTSRKTLRSKQLKWRLLMRTLTLRATSGQGNNSWGKPKKALRWALHTALKPISPSKIVDKLESCRTAPADDEDIVITCFHDFNRLFELPPEILKPFDSLTFRGRQFPVPRGWEHYLEMHYGDWRQLPPEEKRIAHSISHFDPGSDNAQLRIESTRSR